MRLFGKITALQSNTTRANCSSCVAAQVALADYTDLRAIYIFERHLHLILNEGKHDTYKTWTFRSAHPLNPKFACKIATCNVQQYRLIEKFATECSEILMIQQRLTDDEGSNFCILT